MDDGELGVDPSGRGSDRRIGGMRNQAEMGVRGILSRVLGPVKLAAVGYIPAMGESTSLQPTQGLLAVVRGLRGAGHEAWAVGGAVRDCAPK